MMEENVALDSSKQAKFVKSIKGIKKLIKKTADGSKSKKKADDGKIRTGRINKRKSKQRGLVYLSHIPHGFYEHEMTQYFRQFGVVTNARVIKSQRTGRSKGYAFVEFKEPSVAEIVADTMNNYLMGKRLIKAAYIPPEKQRRRVFRRHWTSENNPGSNLRKKMKKAFNADKDEAGDLKRARKLLSNIKKTKEKLTEMGINYDFFNPVDMPEALARQKDKKAKKENGTAETKKTEVKGKIDKVGKPETADKQEKADSDKQGKTDKQGKADKLKTKVINEKKIQPEVNNHIQHKKKQNMKNKGVSPLEDFIKVEESDGDSDSSAAFDSDAFMEMLGQDDSEASEGSDSEAEDGEGNESTEDASDEEEQTPQLKRKEVKAPVHLNKNNETKVQKHFKNADRQDKKTTTPQVLQSKRKVPQNTPPESPKPKFEKHSQKPRNKQFKKKKINN